MPPIISVENLGKRYLVGHQSGQRERYTALRDVMARNAREWLRKTRDLIRGRQIVQGDDVEEFWALRNVSFEVEPGEVVGIIGRNGAGKSTLLKILSRITEPTEGRVTLRGRVASLLEVGTGFHPELTGRENIFLNGAILGMTRAEIRSKFDEIVAFAEVEKFIDTPVKRYSSGMYVRLAFAVAAHLEPEILVVDEVLAVGDVEFQTKCLGKMRDVSGSGRTVLLISHNMSAVMNLCERSIVLSRGRLQFNGATSEAVGDYLALREKVQAFQPRPGQRTGDHQVQITGFKVEPECPATGSPVRFVFHLVRNVPDARQLEVELAVAFLTDHGATVLQLFSKDMNRSFQMGNGSFDVEASIDQLPLTPGTYALNLWAGSGTTPFDWIRDGYSLTVAPGGFIDGHYVDSRGYPVVIPSRWHSR